jgi:hypothetical protein
VYLGRFKANVRIDDTILINGTPSEADDLFSECSNDADGRGWSFVGQLSETGTVHNSGSRASKSLGTCEFSTSIK